MVLPRTREPNAKRDAAADYGTAMHAWAETGESDDPRVLKKLMMSGVRREDWWPEGKHEVTFAIHLPTARAERYSGKRKGVDKWKARHGAEWLTGTIDFLGTHKGRPWVCDLKTGSWPIDPVASRQIQSYLLLPWIEEGTPVREMYYRSVLQFPRYPLEGIPRRTGLAHPVSGFSLRLHLDDLLWSVEHPGEVNPTEDGCRFCECKPACPAMKGKG